MNKIKIILPLLVSYLSLSGLFYIITPQYTRIYIPFIKTTLSGIYPDYFQFRSARLGKDGRTIKCKTVLKGEVIKNGRPVRAELESKTSIQPFFIALYPAIIFSLIICWPNLSLKTRIISVIGVSQLIFCITLLDLSFTIMNSMEARLSIDSSVQDFRKFILQFFNNGGRQFTAIIMAWTSVMVAHWGFDS